MRTTVAAILILFVFLSLQFGKIATYLYCKWQLEIIQTQPGCGCDTHLTAMFDHNEADASGAVAKITLKEKITEYSPQKFFTEPINDDGQMKTGFARYNSPLASSFIPAPFHPPAAYC